MAAGQRRRRMSGNVYGPTYAVTSSSSGSASPWSASVTAAEGRPGISDRPVGPQLLPGLRQRLRQHPRLGDRRHEVGVAVPTWERVDVEVSGYAGAGRTPDVGTDVYAIGPVCSLQRPYRVVEHRPERGCLLALDVFQLGHVPDRHHHQVSALVRVEVED